MADATTSNLFKRESKSHFEKRLQNLNQVKKLTKRQKEWLQAEYKLHNRLAAAEKRGFALNTEELLMQGRTLDASGMSHIPMPKRVTKKDIEALNSIKGTKALLEISDYVSLESVTSGKVKLPKKSRLYMMQLDESVALSEGQATPIVITAHPDYLDATEIGPITQTDKEFISKEGEQAKQLFKGNVQVHDKIDVPEFTPQFTQEDDVVDTIEDLPSTPLTPQQEYYDDNPEFEYAPDETTDRGERMYANIIEMISFAPVGWQQALDKDGSGWLHVKDIKESGRQEVIRFVETAIQQFGEKAFFNILAQGNEETLSKAIFLAIYEYYPWNKEYTEDKTNEGLSKLATIFSGGDIELKMKLDFNNPDNI